VLPITCWVCEYDVEGNRIKRGQISDGESRGEFAGITRDRTGRVTERVIEDDKGEIVRRELMGPYGVTEEDYYQNGKRTFQTTLSYDGNGHVSDVHYHDESGTETESDVYISDASGNFKEQWQYGRNGTFLGDFLETYDPARDIWGFASFNSDGSVKLEVRTQGTKLLSFWEEPGETRAYGSDFAMDPVGKMQESYSCHPDGSCDHIISYFADEARHLVSRIEWHDPTGVLKLSADYQSESDQFGNWVKRAVWVWSPELGERKLYETYYRTLKYWNK
jgi:hypothetical protein